jgi:putative ATPase
MAEDLFGSESEAAGWAPLAARMRPRTLDEYVGQRHLLAEGLPLRKQIETGTVGSCILWAPPGCGKTTLALLIADYARAHAEVRSAVTSGVADIREIAKAAADRRKLHGEATILVLDEIHHFSRTQQDALLGYIEEGTFQLIGVTTESPYFVLAQALLSRARVLPLQPLEPAEIEALLMRALANAERGMGERSLTLEEEAKAFLVEATGGDARIALNALEASAMQAEDGGRITLDMAQQALQKKAIRYDRKGDMHYDTISAFIKSVRGSDADAALHYLARMLEAGEDPRFVVRRLLILASEDIGNADPQGLVVAAAAAQAVERIGMPEAKIVLAQATTYLAEAPKSNRACMGLVKAEADLKDRPAAPVPLHLRNAPVSGYKKLGHGRGYLYPHDFPGGWVAQPYFPKGEWKLPYYDPAEIGYEARIVERRRARNEAKLKPKRSPRREES